GVADGDPDDDQTIVATHNFDSIDGDLVFETTPVDGQISIAGSGPWPSVAAIAVREAEGGPTIEEGAGSASVAVAAAGTGAATAGASGSAAVAVTASAAGQAIVAGAGDAAIELSADSAGSAVVAGAGSAAIAV